MLVAHIDTGAGMRGGQWQALYLLEGLAREGRENVLLAPRSSPLYGMARSRGLDARPLGVAALIGVSRAAEIVHAHDARAHTLGALTGHPRLLVARRVAFPVRRGVFSRWKYVRARHYLAVSRYVKGTLVAAGIDPKRISVVYDGVPLASASTGGERIVAPATEDPKKGAALVRRAAALGGFAVHFSDNLAEDLKSAGAFVYITREEGLGSAVLLAMAAGVPVVASRVGGLTEIVQDGITGLLVENTPEAIAEAVARLREDRALAACMVESARRRVETTFSVEEMVRNTLQVYQRMVEC